MLLCVCVGHKDLTWAGYFIFFVGFLIIELIVLYQLMIGFNSSEGLHEMWRGNGFSETLGHNPRGVNLH